MDTARLGARFWASPSLARLQGFPRARGPRARVRGPRWWRRSPSVFGADSERRAGGLRHGRAPLGRSALDVLVVGTAIATGLYARGALSAPRASAACWIAVGLLWAVAVLGDASEASPTAPAASPRRASYRCFIYLMLSFPEGRLTTAARCAPFPRRRRAWRAFLYIGSVPFLKSYPGHSPWVSCDADCPPNAFLVLNSEPAFIGFGCRAAARAPRGAPLRGRERLARAAHAGGSHPAPG